jgi:hypothetical protein
MQRPRFDISLEFSILELTRLIIKKLNFILHLVLNLHTIRNKIFWSNFFI